jgi:hypothetical protein
MSPDDANAALRAALEDDEALAARFAAATSDDELHALAEELGLTLATEADTGSHELTESDLAAVGGGYTFPRTDWVYCDNPWTNVWCTLKC